MVRGEFNLDASAADFLSDYAGEPQVLNASGTLNIGADSALAGRINAELGSKGLVVARGNLGITGAVRDPLLRP